MVVKQTRKNTNLVEKWIYTISMKELIDEVQVYKNNHWYGSLYITRLVDDNVYEYIHSDMVTYVPHHDEEYL